MFDLPLKAEMHQIPIKSLRLLILVLFSIGAIFGINRADAQVSAVAQTLTLGNPLYEQELIETKSPLSANGLNSSLSLNSNEQWVIECADCPKIFGINEYSLRLDSNGNPRIAYGGDHLYYAWHDGINWNYEMVDASYGVGEYALLALDESGYSHIVYSGYTGDTGNKILYAHQDALGWHVATVGDAVGVPYYLSLDSLGYPYIGYLDFVFPEWEVKTAYLDAQGWHLWSWGNPEAGGISSLVLDSNGFPHVSIDSVACDRIHGCKKNLIYAYRDSTSWIEETINYTVYISTLEMASNLILDSNGFPRIIYNTYNGLEYAYQDSQGWHNEIVVNLLNYLTSGYKSIVLDKNGNPHIIFSDGINLLYGYKDAQMWYVYSVDNVQYSSCPCALVLDVDGYPRVAYHGNGDLMYANLDTQGWHFQSIDHGGGLVGWENSLALDQNNYPHISYEGNGVKYAYRDAQGWHIYTVDPEGAGSSLALDSVGYAHISYRDIRDPWINENLKYAYQDAQGWHVTIIDSLQHIEGHTSIALDNSDYPHISYCGSSPPEIKYAYQDSQGWHITSVNNEEVYCSTLSLALDSDGSPHISFSDGGNLKYAHRDTGEWYITTVDTAGNVNNTAITIDPNDYPHISYQVSSDRKLKYAYQDDQGWHIQTVDSAVVYDGYTSIAIDDESNPHISYYDPDQTSLMYTYHDNTGWHIQTVADQGPGIGYYSSLRLDKDGLPHISYFDWANYDLNYAYLISPTLLINHSLGSPGSFFTVVGSGFVVRREARISVNGEFLGSLISDDKGGLTFLLNTDDADPGDYYVTVSMNPGLSVNFTLDPEAPLRSQEGEGLILYIPSGIAFTYRELFPFIVR